MQKIPKRVFEQMGRFSQADILECVKVSSHSVAYPSATVSSFENGKT